MLPYQIFENNNFSIKNIYGQPIDTFGEKFLSDTTREFLLTPQQKKKRIWIVAGGNVIGYGATMIGLNSAWYKN